MERVEPEIRKKINENLNILIGRAGGVTAFAKTIKVSRDSVNNWLKGKSDIRLNDLVSISKQYNISVDYLLGVSEHRTLNQDEKEAAAYTGLSAEAVSTLHEIATEFDGMDKVYISALSAIIADGDLFDFLETCFTSVHHAKLVSEALASPEDGAFLNTVKQESELAEFAEYKAAKTFESMLHRALNTIYPIDETIRRAEAAAEQKSGEVFETGWEEEAEGRVTDE